MLSILSSIFITFVYQPFFNLLVYIYLVLDKATGGSADMGTALIIFTFIFRILLLPLSIRADRTDKEKREIKVKVSEIEKIYRHEPIRRREGLHSLISAQRSLVIAEFLDVGIQIAVVLMLFRIFRTGLEGADFHLLYSFMPKIKKPFNLIFMGRFDLSAPSLSMNVVSSLVIFLAEFLSLRFSPFPLTSQDKLMLLVLPLGAFTYFAFMPAGKKLFVIATLIFSIILILLRQAVFVYDSLRSRFFGGSKPVWKR